MMRLRAFLQGKISRLSHRWIVIVGLVTSITNIAILAAVFWILASLGALQRLQTKAQFRSAGGNTLQMIALQSDWPSDIRSGRCLTLRVAGQRQAMESKVLSRENRVVVLEIPPRFLGSADFPGPVPERDVLIEFRSSVSLLAALFQKTMADTDLTRASGIEAPGRQFHSRETQ